MSHDPLRLSLPFSSICPGRRRTDVDIDLSSSFGSRTPFSSLVSFSSKRCCCFPFEGSNIQAAREESNKSETAVLCISSHTSRLVFPFPLDWALPPSRTSRKSLVWWWWCHAPRDFAGSRFRPPPHLGHGVGFLPAAAILPLPPISISPQTTCLPPIWIPLTMSRHGDATKGKKWWSALRVTMWLLLRLRLPRSHHVMCQCASWPPLRQALAPWLRLVAQLVARHSPTPLTTV